MNTRNKEIGNSKAKHTSDKFIRIKDKEQVTIPRKTCKALGLNNGDLLRIEIKNNWIILIPQLIIDKKKKLNPLLLRKVNFSV